MSKKSSKLVLPLLLIIYIAIILHLFWPRFSYKNGPFFTIPYTVNLSESKALEFIELKRFGMTAYALETITIPGEPNRTAILIKNKKGKILETHTTDKRYGTIKLLPENSKSLWWGGWQVGIDPDKTRDGAIYISPLGKLQYFFIT